MLLLMANLNYIILVSTLLLRLLQACNCEQVSGFLDEDYAKFRVKSALTSTNGTEFCTEFVPILNKTVLNICDDESDLQVWFFDEDSRFRSLAYPSDPVSNNAFVYNSIDNTIASMMLYLTVRNETAAVNKAVFLIERNPCLIGQKWFLQEVVPDNEIKYIGNPCSEEDGGCPVCSGDCDSDQDCQGNSRCLQRHYYTGRENVPGCMWKGTNDRFHDDDYCFEPIALPGVVNVVGKCDYDRPCNECEGHCNKNSDCAPGLQCKWRYGFEAVPGCTGAGGIRDVYGKGICFNKTVPEAKVRWGNKCTSTNKCNLCFGNCTVDADCAGELRCAHREKGVKVPGCEFPTWLLNDRSHNHCFLPYTFPSNAGRVSYVGECGPDTYLCKRCEGGCKSDEDCEGGLKCKERNGFQIVPGCFEAGSNMDMFGKNVCYDADEEKKILQHCWRPSGYCSECTSCHSDHDCAKGLRCAQRLGLEDVPGCRWRKRVKSLTDFLEGTSYCFKPEKRPGEINYIGECSRDGYLCGLCEGGCRYDSDCQYGLKCLYRAAFDDVPGCSSPNGPRDMYGKGICFDPNFIPPSTSTCNAGR